MDGGSRGVMPTFHNGTSGAGGRLSVPTAETAQRQRPALTRIARTLSACESVTEDFYDRGGVRRICASVITMRTLSPASS
jgi:hypothetical protein